MKEKEFMRVNLWLVATMLAISLSLIGLISCKKTDESNSLRIMFAGKTTSLELLPQQMSQIYYNVHQKQQFFDSCKVVEQLNGYTIIVAIGTNNDGETIKFATIADKDGEVLLLRDNPSTTCTCEGNCNDACNPYYIGPTYEWECTQCDPNQLPPPKCTKTVSASQPIGGGNQ